MCTIGDVIQEAERILKSSADEDQAKKSMIEQEHGQTLGLLQQYIDYADYHVDLYPGENQSLNLAQQIDKVVTYWQKNCSCVVAVLSQILTEKFFGLYWIVRPTA